MEYWDLKTVPSSLNCRHTTLALFIIIGAIISFINIWRQAFFHRNDKLPTARQPSTSQQIQTICICRDMVTGSILWHLGKWSRWDLTIHLTPEPREMVNIRRLQSKDSQKNRISRTTPPQRLWTRAKFEMFRMKIRSVQSVVRIIEHCPSSDACMARHAFKLSLGIGTLPL